MSWNGFALDNYASLHQFTPEALPVQGNAVEHLIEFMLLFLQILLKQNTAVLSTCMYVCHNATIVTSQLFQLFDDLEHENHTFFESISSRLTILTTLTT